MENSFTKLNELPYFDQTLKTLILSKQLTMTADKQESIPEKQKAVVYTEHGGKVELQEIPVPKIGDDDILIKVLFTGVCHTDVSLYIFCT